MVYGYYLPIFIQPWLSATFSQYILLSQVSRFRSYIPFIFWHHRYFQRLTHLTNTSMHSSRMRTARSPSMHCTGGSGECLLLGESGPPGEGNLLPGEGKGLVCSGGLGESAPRRRQGGFWSSGVYSHGGGGGVLSRHALRQTPSVNRMTGVKT